MREKVGNPDTNKSVGNKTHTHPRDAYSYASRRCVLVRIVEEIILCTLAAARISEEVGIFLGDGYIMLRECFRVKPGLLPFPSIEVHKNFLLIFGRELLPPFNVLKIASLIGLGAFLILETKEGAILL